MAPARAAALGLALALAAAGCRGRAPLASGPRLLLEVQPPSPSALPGGTLVRVVARPQPGAGMEWVRGRLQLLGAPQVEFQPDPRGGTWSFSTMVPPFAEVPAGNYDIHVWGRTSAGADLVGEASYEVK